MRRIVAASLRFRFLVVAMAAVLLIVGFAQVQHSSVDVFPEFAPPKVEVQTLSIGLSPSEVESLVTVPLEETLNGVPGLDVIRSKSAPQLSVIAMLFKPGTDRLHARQSVQERLNESAAQLPTWAAPPVMIQPLSSTSRVMKIGLTSKNLNLMQLSMMSYWTIRNRLLRVPGVANVPIWGERLQLLQVQTDPERLKAQNVSLEKVMDATSLALDSGILKFENGQFVGTGGFLDTPEQRLNVQHVLPIPSPSDLAQVVVDDREGQPLRLADVATVQEGEPPLIGDAVINDGPGLMLIVEKLPWANTLDVTRGVEQALKQLQPGLSGVQVDPAIFRPADFIERALHNLSRALILGSLLMVIMLFFFLWEWRVALISVVAMPLSLVVAITVTPALALILLRNAPLERHQSPLVTWLHRGYERVLRPIIRTPRPAFAVVALITVAAVLVIPRLGEELFPTFKEDEFLSHWLTKPGTSLTEQRRITEAVSREIRAIPGVRDFGSHIGQAFNADEPNGVDFAENWISIDPKADYDATLEKIEDVVNGYPGLFRNVETYLAERIEETISGSGSAIVVRIFGPDLDKLRTKADEVAATMSKVNGVTDLTPELQTDVPNVVVQVDLAKAEKFGLKPGDVRRQASTLVEGEEVGDIYRNAKTYDVNVWSIPNTRSSFTGIQNLPIDTPEGQQIRLADVADVAIKPTPNFIRHESQQRRIDVLANADGRDLGSVVKDIKQRLGAVKFPVGYHSEVLGEYKERQDAQHRLLFFGVAGAIAILLLLQSTFSSWRLAILTFLTLPIALVGGLLAAYMTGGVLSMGSLIGLFTVLGVVARHKIMLIDHYRHLERYEGMTFGRDLVVRGARERLSPILMTTLAAGLALIPLIAAGDIPGQEIEYPMAIVILGGLVTATLQNLFIVPSLYLRYGKSPRETAELLHPTTPSGGTTVTA